MIDWEDYGQSFFDRSLAETLQMLLQDEQPMHEFRVARHGLRWIVQRRRK